MALYSLTPCYTAQIPVRVLLVKLGKYNTLVINQAEVSSGWGGSTLTSTCLLLCYCLGTISRTANPASKQVSDPGKPPDQNCCAFPFVVYIFAHWVALRGGWPGIFCGSGKGRMTKLLLFISVMCPITWPTMEPGRRCAGAPSASVIQISCLRQRCHEWLQKKLKVPVMSHQTVVVPA